MTFLAEIFKTLDKYPCRIGDGPQTPDDVPKDYVVDMTNDWRQEKVDDVNLEILMEIVKGARWQL